MIFANHPRHKIVKNICMPLYTLKLGGNPLHNFICAGKNTDYPDVSPGPRDWVFLAVSVAAVEFDTAIGSPVSPRKGLLPYQETFLIWRSFIQVSYLPIMAMLHTFIKGNPPRLCVNPKRGLSSCRLSALP